jgi:ubiquinone/menaquinone biosynthesis C-methylase UbiE
LVMVGWSYEESARLVVESISIKCYHIVNTGIGERQMPTYPEFIDPYDKASANLFVRVEHLARYLYASEYIRKHRLKSVLDAACGNGYGCRALAKHAPTVCGVDCNAALIEQGQRLTSTQNISYHAANLDEGLGFLADNSFDCITCFETLEHVRKDEQLLAEFHRILRRGGKLFLSVPKAGYEPVEDGGRPANPYHLRLYSIEGLIALLERAGFAVERTLGQPYTNISRVNMEDYYRDSAVSSDKLNGYFIETPGSMEFFARMWGWPAEEAQDKSNVAFLICRNAR